MSDKKKKVKEFQKIERNAMIVDIILSLTVIILWSQGIIGFECAVLIFLALLHFGR